MRFSVTYGDIVMFMFAMLGLVQGVDSTCRAYRARSVQLDCILGGFMLASYG